MNKSNLITLITFVSLIFAIGKIAMNQLCNPTQNNVVVNVISDAISKPSPIHGSAKPDPFSWEPLLQRLVAFLSKACTS
jgi:hypothetical protein